MATANRVCNCKGQRLQRAAVGKVRPTLKPFSVSDKCSRFEDDDADVDISRDAQIRDVEATFPPSYRGIDKESIKHPNKPGRKAVEVFDLLPDPETFATTSDIFRFPERPGERSLLQEDPRLDSALLRPVRLDDGENFIAYYLAREDKQAIELKEQRNVSLELNVATDTMVGHLSSNFTQCTVFIFISAYRMTLSGTTRQNRTEMSKQTIWCYYSTREIYLLMRMRLAQQGSMWNDLRASITRRLADDMF